VLAKLQSEAQLAAVLAHEVAHVAGPDCIQVYSAARFASCRIAVTGLALVEAGAANVPGGDQFVLNAKFGRTMRALAGPNGLAADDPADDRDFMLWFVDRSIELQRLKGFGPEVEQRADAEAAAMLRAAGYDASALEQALGLLEPAKNDARIAALAKARGGGAAKGKMPAFPADVHMPR
jgi:predicted Zn-dependent protease